MSNNLGKAVLGTLTAVLLTGGATAQPTGDVEGYQLPPTRTQAPVEGPVDAEHPVATPTTATMPAPAPATLPSAAPAATPGPRITLPATTAPQPAERRAPPREAAATPIASPSAGIAPLPVIPTDQPSLAPPQSDAPPMAAEQSQEVAPGGKLPWWPIAGAALIAIAAAAFWLRSRHRPVAAAEEAPDPLSNEPVAPASAPAALTPIAKLPAMAKPAPEAPPPAPEPATVPAPAVSGPMTVSLEPQSLRLSFVYATLSYRLTLTNIATDPLEAVRITGDLTSAHVSRPPAEQLALDGTVLPLLHELAALAPRETATVGGELQLPLAAILPLRAGRAAMFAPLARFRIAAGAVSDMHVFTLGLPSDRAGGTMQPVRLDHGPQLFRPVEHRKIEIARWLALDEARRAG